MITKTAYIWLDKLSANTLGDAKCVAQVIKKLKNTSKGKEAVDGIKKILTNNKDIVKKPKVAPVQKKPVQVQQPVQKPAPAQKKKLTDEQKMFLKLMGNEKTRKAIIDFSKELGKQEDTMHKIIIPATGIGAMAASGYALKKYNDKKPWNRV